MLQDHWFQLLGTRFLFFFWPSKKARKNTFFIVFPIVQPIWETWRAIFPIVRPVVASVHCKKHQIYHSRDQYHFQKSITNFHFLFQFFPSFLCFFCQNPHMWEALLFKSYRYFSCKKRHFWTKIIIFFIFLSFLVKISISKSPYFSNVIHILGFLASQNHKNEGKNEKIIILVRNVSFFAAKISITFEK